MSTSRHAYLIAAYENYYVLERTMRLLDDDRNDIYLHVDRKARGFDAPKFAAICSRSRLTLLPRKNVYWGDYTQVASAISLLRAALTSGGDYGYLHFLSDSDMPIKSQDEIHTFFEANAGKEFVAFNQWPRWADDWIHYSYPLNRLLRARSATVRKAYQRFRHWSLALQKRAGRRRNLRAEVDVKYGSDWFSISRELAAHVVSNEDAIRKMFRRSFLPSEFYLQTLVWKSEFRERVFDYDNPYRSNLRHIDFQRGSGGSPHTFRIEDLDELLQSDRLFARKFSPIVDRQVIEALYESLSGESVR